jgi:hypothetical protein
VPLNPIRAETCEDPSITGPAGRAAHVSAPGHRRCDHLDSSVRLQQAGFEVDTFRMTPPPAVTCGLLPAAWLYIARQPLQPSASIPGCRGFRPRVADMPGRC